MSIILIYNTLENASGKACGKMEKKYKNIPWPFNLGKESVKVEPLIIKIQDFTMVRLVKTGLSKSGSDCQLVIYFIALWGFIVILKMNKCQ